MERIPVDEQLPSLLTVVQQLQQEVRELRRENAELRQQVIALQCDVGYSAMFTSRFGAICFGA